MKQWQSSLITWAHLLSICDSQRQLKMENLISTYTNHNHLNDVSIPEADFHQDVFNQSRNHWTTSTEVNPGAQMSTVSQIVNMFSKL